MVKPPKTTAPPTPVCTSPLLILEGFGSDPEDQCYLRPEIHQIPAEAGAPARAARNVDFAPALIRHHNELEKQLGTHRVVALPDFCLNDTSYLRVGLWFPCFRRPTRPVGLSLAPCVFRDLSQQQFKEQPPPRSAVGREFTLYLKNEAVVAEDPEAPDAYIHAVCWFPRDEVLTTDPMARLDLAHTGYHIDVHQTYRRELESDEGACETDPDSKTTTCANSRTPAVWYGFAARTGDPAEFSTAPPPPDHDTMCRSWLTIRWRGPPKKPRDS